MALTKTDKIRLFQQMTGWSVDKMRANKKQIDALLNDESISFIEQELTEEQKAQARENIGAVDEQTVEDMQRVISEAFNRIPIQIKFL